MGQSTLLKYVVNVLEEHKIGYFITGSVAAMKYGETRLTNDIDIVVRLARDCIESFCRCFPEPEYYLSMDAVREAVDRGGQFNILHPFSGYKVDIMLVSYGEYDRLRFHRALRGKVDKETIAWVASAEDVILKKMQYYKEGQHEKHLRDITGIIKMQGERLDRVYIGQWAEKLEVGNIWKALVQRCGKKK